MQKAWQSDLVRLQEFVSDFSHDRPPNPGQIEPCSLARSLLIALAHNQSLVDPEKVLG